MKEHKCPNCGSTHYESTCMGFPSGVRNENEIRCFDCGWKGYTYQMDGYVGPLVASLRNKKIEKGE